MNKEIATELENAGSSLAVMDIKVPYTVPVGYFSDFEREISSVVASEERIRNAGSASLKETYAVPDNYFETLPARVMKKVAPPKPVVRLIDYKWIRFAAAAMLLVAIGLGMINTLSPTTATSPKRADIAQLDERDIIEYLGVAGSSVASLDPVGFSLDKYNLDNKDIVTYLDQTGWDTDNYN